jgi:hypothetical protein
MKEAKERAALAHQAFSAFAREARQEPINSCETTRERSGIHGREGRPEASLVRTRSEEAEARGSLKQSRAGGLCYRGGLGSALDQSADQSRARGGGGERLRQRGGEAIESRGERAEERSETASLPPEANSKSLTESEREEESREQSGADLLPRQSAETVERVRERREGRGAERRSEHDQESRGARRSPVSRETIQRREPRARGGRPD